MPENRHTADRETHDKVSAPSLDRFKPITNYVLCRPVPYTKVTSSGIYLGVLNENQYISEYTDRMFEVVKLPYFLRHTGKLNAKNRPMEWVTEIEIKTGDTIWASADESANHLKIEIEGETYAMIHYEGVRALKRGGELFPVNGWVICEEVYEKERVLSYEKDVLNPKKLKVVFTGRHNKGYVRARPGGTFVTLDLDFPHDGLKKGDIVIKLDERMGVPLEGSFKEFYEKKNYILIQTRHIAGVA